MHYDKEFVHRSAEFALFDESAPSVNIYVESM